MLSKLLPAAGVTVVAAALAMTAPAPATAAPLPSSVRNAVPALKGLDRPLVRTLSATGRIPAPRTDGAACGARLLEPGTAGVAQRRFVAPADGIVRANLLGAARGSDWDLALFDAKGERVRGSYGFGAFEMASTGLRRGAAVTVQACRRAGSDRTVRLRTSFARVDFAKLSRNIASASLVRVAVAGREQFNTLELLGFDVTHDVGPGYAMLVTYSPAEIARLRSLGYSVTTVIGDLLAADNASRRRDRAATRAALPSALPTGRTEYREYEDFGAELKEIVAKYPKLARAISLKGRSYLGSELQTIELSADVARTDDGRPTVYFNGIHHAREWPSAEGVMEFAWDLVKGYGTDPAMTKLLDETRILIQPIVNPDGYQVSRGFPDPEPNSELAGLYQTTTGVVLFGGSLTYKRKNCNPTNGLPSDIPCELAIGVDPNRNYAEKWGGPGASSNPNDQGYRGPAPLSEGEPQTVIELQNGTNSLVHISVHNVAAKVLRPPGLEADGKAPDEVILAELGRQMAEPAGYANEYGFQLYDVTGGTKDEVYAATGSLGYTVEMGPKNGNFHGDYQVSVVDEYLGTGERAGRGLREAFVAAVKAASNPAWQSRLTGRAPAGRTLRITKSFTTDSYPVCGVSDPLPVDPLELIGVPDGDNPSYCTAPGEVIKTPEKLDYTTTVPASGRFTWWTYPSTRPFLGAKGTVETFHLTCEQGGQVLGSLDVMVARGELKDLGDVPCGPGGSPTSNTPTSPGQPPATPGQGTTSGTPRIKLGKVTSPLAVINRRRRALLRVGVEGTALRNVKVVLLGRTGTRVLGSAKLGSVTARSRVIRVRLARGVKLQTGTYRLRFTGTQAGKPFTVTRTTRIQPAKPR